MSDPTDPHALTTVDVPTTDVPSTADTEASGGWSLTLLLHPDPDRVGGRAPVPQGEELRISRVSPLFHDPEGRPARALDTPLISRSPLRMKVGRTHLELHAAEGGRRARVAGQSLRDHLRLPLDSLKRDGALIEVGGCVLLWLAWGAGPVGPIDELGLVGLSPVMRHLRARIRAAARAASPVLIRGETGTGKELVARAIHQLGPRKDHPLVSVNMAAIPSELASATLFGHSRGAFTGAVREEPGLFGQADGGTLFLDEVGETPAPVQPQLLRALDSGEIQPAGRPPRRVDVRVISATDADLEQLVEDGAFRQALYFRLRGVQLSVPPLRARRVDVPLLLLRFLSEELERLGAPDLLEPPPPGSPPWLGLKLVLNLMSRRFTGNVRELRSLAAQITLYSLDHPSASLPPEDAPYVSEPPTEEPESGGSLDPESVREAMRQHQWRVRQSADALGISRNTLVAAIERIADLRLARDLDAETIQRALDTHGDELAAAAALEVSAHGLKLRMRALGLRG
ncbi:MAG: sigma-54-dependent Fis family transcriptional regulator [Alphaproteobacteria bacterium]|nr:sigma-54-dependent Fis family transcriptional regulator [Alphaproteobacteria bacterium]